MKKSTIYALSAIALATACSEPNTTAATLDPPSVDVTRNVVVDAYEKKFGRSPQGLSVSPVATANVFALETDFVACVQTTERTGFDTFNTDGSISRPRGTAFRQSAVILIRKYDFGWGSGIFRNYEDVKIGRLNISDLCPPSS